MMLKTFTVLEYLLIEFDRLSATQQALLRHGYATRTDAGANFHMTVMQELVEVNNKLMDYPQEWIDAVLTIKSLRKMKWTKVTDQLPPQYVVVSTKVEDEQGTRNEQPLKMQKGLWWLSDGSMYVYYNPTHWRFI